MDSEVNCERLERELEDLSTERQKVIAWACRNIITEDDLQTQLTLLTLQENAIRRELAEKRLLVGDRANRLLELAIEYREQVKAGWEVILSDPVSPEQEKRQFEFKKMVIQAIVSRVEVHPDKSIDVHFDLELPKVVNISNMTL